MELGPVNGITKKEAVTWSVYLRTLNRSLRRSLLKSQWCDDPKKSFYKVLLQETIKFKDYPSFVWCYYKWVSENKTTGVKITPVKVNLKRLRIPTPIIKLTRTNGGWNQKTFHKPHEVVEVEVTPVIEDIRTVTIEEYNMVPAHTKRITKASRKFFE